MSKRLTRKEAKLDGEKFYYTGKVCKHNHENKRLVSSGSCYECARQVSRNDYKKNSEARLAKSKQWRGDNKERHYDSVKQWRSNNPTKQALYNNERRSAQLERTPIWCDEWDKFVKSEIYELRKIRSVETKFEWNVDHIVPLRGALVSGLNVWNNLQLIPALLNKIKSNKHTEEV